MNIYTSDRYEDGLCLISTESFIGLVNIEFPDKDISIKEYEKWYEQVLNNVLPIYDTSYPLQYIYKSSITVITSINSIAQSEFDKRDLKSEDVLVPFLGGIKGVDFRELVTRLWDLHEIEHYKNVGVIRKYYEELFKSLESKQKEN